MKKINYCGQTIEEVTVNDMTMYKWNGEIFSSIKHVHQTIWWYTIGRYGCSSAVNYGYKDLTDPFEDLDKDGYLRGIKL